MINDNKWSVQKLINCDDSSYHFDNDKIKVTFCNDGYSYFKAFKIIKNINENSVYNFYIKFESKDVLYKFVFTFYDKNRKQLSRGYLNNNDNFMSPENACELEIGIIVYSKNKGEFKLNELIVEFKSSCEKRLVTLGAIALDYDYGRTCEMNLLDSLNKIDEISKEKPDLIVLTEGFYDRCVKCTLQEGSIKLTDRPIKLLMEKAKKYGTYIVTSIHEVDNGYYYNTAVVIDRNGNIAGTYRKTHLTLSEYEVGIVPGDEIRVFETDFGKIGVAICWDLFFPEMVRALHLKGVEIICNPTAGFEKSRTVARAQESGSFIVTSAVDERHQTRITDPLGNKLDDAVEKGYAISTVDLNKQYYVYWLSCPSYTTSKNIYLHERREDLYIESYKESNITTP